MSSSASPGLMSIPKELLSKIVKDDLPAPHDPCQSVGLPMNVWNAITSGPENPGTPLQPCLGHAMPRERTISRQAQHCSMRLQPSTPILFHLSQVCKDFRSWLLADWTLWPTIILYNPRLAEAMVSRMPVDAVLHLVHVDGICHHGLEAICQYISAARSLDVALPAWLQKEPSYSTCSRITKYIATAKNLQSLTLRFDARGPFLHPLSSVTVMMSLKHVSLLNATGLFVGPNVTDLCLASEGNGGTKMYFDVLLAALRQCPRLANLDLQGILHQDDRGWQPWMLQQAFRAGTVRLPHLQHILCGGTHIDPLTLLYGLELSHSVNLHFDMGYPMGMVSAMGVHWMALPMLVFAAPQLSRELIDNVWQDLIDSEVWGTELPGPADDGGEDPADQPPALVDEFGQNAIDDGAGVRYPVLRASWQWLDHTVCAYATARHTPACQLADETQQYRVIGFHVGEKCRGLDVSHRHLSVKHHIPDFVTLVAGSSVRDVTQCLERDMCPSALRTQNPTRSLTVRHVPDHGDQNNPMTASVCLGMLFEAYTRQCDTGGATRLVVGNMSSQLVSHIAWQPILIRIPGLVTLSIASEVDFDCVYFLAHKLADPHFLCPALRDVRLCCVTSKPGLAEPQSVDKVIVELRRITQHRQTLVWHVDGMKGAAILGPEDGKPQ